MKTIELLKEAGYEVTIEHERAPEGGALLSNRAHYEDRKPYNEGSATWLTPSSAVTSVTISDGEASFTGRSWCSLNDQFDRKLGITIAIGRAMKRGRGVIKLAQRSPLEDLLI